MSAEGKRKRRNWLYHKQKHRCLNCGQLMVLPPAIFTRGHRPPKNEATLYHLAGKLHPLRGKLEPNTILVCLKCNREFSQQAQEQVPIDLRRAMANAFPREEPEEPTDA